MFFYVQINEINSINTKIVVSFLSKMKCNFIYVKHYCNFVDLLMNLFNIYNFQTLYFCQVCKTGVLKKKSTESFKLIDFYSIVKFNLYKGRFFNTIRYLNIYTS